MPQLACEMMREASNFLAQLVQETDSLLQVPPAPHMTQLPREVTEAARKSQAAEKRRADFAVLGAEREAATQETLAAAREKGALVGMEASQGLQQFLKAKFRQEQEEERQHRQAQEDREEQFWTEQELQLNLEKQEAQRAQQAQQAHQAGGQQQQQQQQAIDGHQTSPEPGQKPEIVDLTADTPAVRNSSAAMSASTTPGQAAAMDVDDVDPRGSSLSRNGAAANLPTAPGQAEAASTAHVINTTQVSSASEQLHQTPREVHPSTGGGTACLQSPDLLTPIPGVVPEHITGAAQGHASEHGAVGAGGVSVPSAALGASSDAGSLPGHDANRASIPALPALPAGHALGSMFSPSPAKSAKHVPGPPLASTCSHIPGPARGPAQHTSAPGAAPAAAASRGSGSAPVQTSAPAPGAAPPRLCPTPRL